MRQAPSCHSKKLVQFGELLRDYILYPIPHRQYVFTIPVKLRLYDRRLLSDPCRCAYDSLSFFLKTAIGLSGSIPGANVDGNNTKSELYATEILVKTR